MPSLKEIKGRIASVSSTLKITSAMKMVASAKLHKAQAAIGNMLPYEQRLSRILADLLAVSEQPAGAVQQADSSSQKNRGYAPQNQPAARQDAESVNQIGTETSGQYVPSDEHIPKFPAKKREQTDRTESVAVVAWSWSSVGATSMAPVPPMALKWMSAPAVTSMVGATYSSYPLFSSQDTKAAATAARASMDKNLFMALVYLVFRNVFR